MRKYVIMGVPGAGKSTQAGALRLDLDLVHISVGDIFRWNVQNHTKEYVVTIDATQDRDEVQQAIRGALGLPAYRPAQYAGNG